MEDSEEKFLEGYAQNIENGGDLGMKVELAKAGGNVTNQPKMIHRLEQNEAMDVEGEPEGRLTIDVYQAPNEIIVESAVAGVEPDDIDINVTSDSITIKGKRHRSKEIKDEDYFYQECYWGKFSRSVILPQEVDAENAYASFRNGILTVHLPKVSRQKTKKIKVKLE